MLSKEEIEYIEDLEKAIEDNDSFYWQEDMYELIEIIRKQHGREQKLIEKLEERIKEYKEKSGGNTYHIQSMINAEIRELEWVLSIMKGE